MLRLSKKPLVVKGMNGAGYLFLLPGAMLVGGLFMLSLVGEDMPYKEGMLVTIPREMWGYVVLGIRSGLVVGALFLLYIFAATMGQLVKDGYIEAVARHAERLAAEREADAR